MSNFKEKNKVYKAKINGYDIFVYRAPIGFYNGYVELPKDDKYYGVEYDNIPLSVHGGLTYSEQDGDKYIIGFDTSHYGDLSSREIADDDFKQSKYDFLYDGDGVFRDIDYLISELEGLTKQLQGNEND